MGETTNGKPTSHATTEENHILLEDIPNKVEIEHNKNPSDDLLYKVTDKPPIHLTILFALQHALLALSASLASSTIVADVTCAADFPDIKTDLLSSTLFMNGITTLLVTTLGVRLPLYQGAASMYVIPLLTLQSIDKNFCDIGEKHPQYPLNNMTFVNDTNMQNDGLNETEVDTLEMRRNVAFFRLREGSLIVVGIFHCLVGATGTVGFLMKFIGPITIVPTILIGGIFLSKSAAKFARAHWGISSVTAITSIVLSLYLGYKKMPCPAWSRKKGFYIHWYPLHRVFAIIIGMLVGWSMSAIMTYTDALSDDPKSAEYLARTDARAGIIQQANLFRVPYPNQFGTPLFNVTVFVAFLIATIISILDSIGDYNACARVCNVPPPPTHGVNRGIAFEGLCSTFSGVIGCGHATSTYGSIIGALGVTKVASRSVFIWVAGIYIIFGVVGKVSATFITIPYPVLGGAMLVIYGMFNGIVLSNLEAISLKSTRNLAIIGISILIGILLPHWLEKYPDDVSTGSPYYDNILKNLLGNPNFSCGLVACILDNTVPGTLDERGISVWLEPEKADKALYSEGVEIYRPLLPSKVLSLPIMKYIPFLPFQPREKESKNQENDI